MLFALALALVFAQGATLKHSAEHLLPDTHHSQLLCKSFLGFEKSFTALLASAITPVRTNSGGQFDTLLLAVFVNFTGTVKIRGPPQPILS